jgi:hypothetical protein
MKRALLPLLAAMAFVAPVTVTHAQTAQGVVVSSCGSPSVVYSAGFPYPITQDTAGKLCIGGTISVSPFPNYALETGGNLAALAAAINSPIPSNKSCAASGVSGTLKCGNPGVALIDFAITPDATAAAAGYFIIILDTNTVPGAGAVTYEKCYQVPSSYGTASYGATYGAGGVTQNNGLVILISSTGCGTYTVYTHATAIQASYQ